MVTLADARDLKSLRRMISLMADSPPLQNTHRRNRETTTARPQALQVSHCRAVLLSPGGWGVPWTSHGHPSRPRTGQDSRFPIDLQPAQGRSCPAMEVIVEPPQPETSIAQSLANQPRPAARIAKPALGFAGEFLAFQAGDHGPIGARTAHEKAFFLNQKHQHPLRPSET